MKIKYLGIIVVSIAAVMMSSTTVYAQGYPGVNTVLRFINLNGGRHFYTASVLEGNTAGFHFQKIAFSAFAYPYSNYTKAVYRCYLPGGDDHFVSTDPNCEGTNFEGLFGYISDVPGGGGLIHRFFCGNNDHLITQDVFEGLQAGCQYEGALGYST